MADDAKAAFWDKKAETFPRYEPGDNTYEASMLRRINDAGVNFQGKSVLDVGSGSGMYTLRLAREAARVTAVDVSGEMLRILREDAEAQSIANIDYIHSNWDDFDPGRTFDVIFCSMTPAIESDASRRKLLRLSHGKTAFMGFAEVMDSDILSGVFAEYGVTPRVFNNGPEMREWLEAEGIPCRSILVDGQWVEQRSREEAIKSCTSMLIPYDVTPDRAFLERHLEQFRKGPDVYVEHTDYKIELLIWDNPATA